MSYLALYRKYRPINFEEVIDQNHITKTLTNQIKNDKIGHAYLFCGSRGTGKTSTAKIFARAINCLNPQNGSPCNKCDVCKAMTDTNMDILEIDAASNNGVDEVRDLREKIKYPPVLGKYKVYIIDEVHMLTTSAFNALLKTIEEPPAHAVFVLATTEVHKLPATVLSRCMRFDFKLVSTNAISDLIEKIFIENSINYDKKAVDVIARAGEGSVRDALSIADMVVSFSDSNVTFESVMEVVGAVEKEKLASIVQSIMDGDVGNVLVKLDKILGEGKSSLVLSRELISYFRDLLVILTVPESARSMVLVTSDIYKTMESQAKQDNYSIIVRAIEKLSEIEQDLRYSVHPKIVLETGVLRAIHYDDLEKRIKSLESTLNDSSFVTNQTNNSIKENNQNPVQKEYDSETNKDKTTEVKKEFVEETEEQRKENRDLIFGELLRFLRKNSHMILYSICSDFEDVRIEGNKLIFSVDDNATLNILQTDANIKIFDEFFSKHGMGYIFDYISREEIEEELRGKFGQKLKITDN